MKGKTELKKLCEKKALAFLAWLVSVGAQD